MSAMPTGRPTGRNWQSRCLFLRRAIGIWNTMGINMVYFLAALQTIPPELYEAARIDGAGAFAQFFSITIPMVDQNFFLAPRSTRCC